MYFESLLIFLKNLNFYYVVTNIFTEVNRRRKEEKANESILKNG